MGTDKIGKSEYFADPGVRVGQVQSLYAISWNDDEALKESRDKEADDRIVSRLKKLSACENGTQS